jgi:mono/diheme cytochrome c family protein
MKRVAPILAMCLTVANCGQNMTDQPKYQQYEPGPLFRDGAVLQGPVAGTVARGDIDRERTAAEKPALNAGLLSRGREQFDVFCSPCHGRTGAGLGMIVERGMPQPSSFHSDRMRMADDQHIFDVITNGYGVMYSHAARVPPQYRWAIVAYIRALQLSQNAKLDDVPADERERLLSEATP